MLGGMIFGSPLIRNLRNLVSFSKRVKILKLWQKPAFLAEAIAIAVGYQLFNNWHLIADS